MTVARGLLAALSVLLGVLVQQTVLSRLGLPGGRPDLVLLVVVAVGLADGPGAGTLVGFGAGLTLDCLGDHPIGLQALVLCLVGYAVGRYRDEVDRSTIGPLLAVAAAAAGSTLLFAAIGAVLSDPRVGWTALARELPASVGYDLLLAPFVLPVVTRLVAGSGGADTKVAPR